MKSTVNLNNINHLNQILCGAAITIQSAWRAYKTKNQFSFQNKLSIEYLNNQFQADVILFANDKVYYCHSFVLWHSSIYFRQMLENFEKNISKSGSIAYNRACQNGKFKYKFELLFSSQYWELIHKFIYGYRIEFNIDLFSELLTISTKLKIYNLVNELNKEFNYFILNNKTEFSIDDYFKQPLEMFSTYFKFFKNVLLLFGKNKLSLKQTHDYLSSNYINYSQMTRNELVKCIELIRLANENKMFNSKLFKDLIQVLEFQKTQLL